MCHLYVYLDEPMLCDSITIRNILLGVNTLVLLSVRLEIKNNSDCEIKKIIK